MAVDYCTNIQLSMHQPKNLGELKGSIRVYAVCEPCKRSEILNVRDLIRRYGAQVPISWFKRMLRCTRCGRRSATLKIIERA